MHRAPRVVYALFCLASVAPGCARQAVTPAGGPPDPQATAADECESASAGADEGSVSGVRVDSLDLGDTYEFRREKLTHLSSAFSPDTEVVYAVASLSAVGPPGEVAGRWVHLDSDTHLAARSVSQSGPHVTARFSLTRPTAGWPLGRYKFYLSVNGEDVAGSEFVVASESESGVERASKD